MGTFKTIGTTAAASLFVMAQIAGWTTEAQAAEVTVRDRIYYGGCVAVDDRLVRPGLRLAELYNDQADGDELAFLAGLANLFVRPLISNTLGRFRGALRRAAGADGENVKEITATRAIEARPGEVAPCIQFIRGNFFSSLEAMNSSSGEGTGMGQIIDAELKKEGIYLNGQPDLFLELAIKQSTAVNALALAPTYFRYGGTLKKNSRTSKSRGIGAAISFYNIGENKDATTAKTAAVPVGDFKSGDFRQFSVLPTSINSNPPADIGEKALSKFHDREGVEITSDIHDALRLHETRRLANKKFLSKFHKSIGDAEALGEFHKKLETGDFSDLHRLLATNIVERIHNDVVKQEIQSFHERKCDDGRLVQIDSIDDIRVRDCNYFTQFETESDWFSHFNPMPAEPSGDDSPRVDLTSATPFNMSVSLIETRDVNQFLLFLSDVFNDVNPETGDNPLEDLLVGRLTPTEESVRITALSTALQLRNTFGMSFKNAWLKIDQYCDGPTGDSGADRDRRRTLAETARVAQEQSNLDARKAGEVPRFTRLIPLSALEGGAIQCPR